MKEKVKKLTKRRSYKPTVIKLKYRKDSIKHHKLKPRMESALSPIEIRRALVLYVIKKALGEYGHTEIDKLRIVKILYLLDKKFKEDTKSHLSPYNYILERLGPLSWEILDDLEQLKSENVISNVTSFYDFKLNSIPQKENINIETVRVLIENNIDTHPIFELATSLNHLLNYVHSLPEVKSAKLHGPIAF